jgi:hypothetical protein
MGIRFYCPNGHRLNVKSQLAGKRGYCPHCNAKVTIPEIPPEQKLPPELLAESFAIPQELQHNSDSNGATPSWYVRPPSGGQFGPVNAAQLNRWIAERRVPAQSQLLKEGWRQWKVASSVFDADGFVAADLAHDSALIQLEAKSASLLKGSVARRKRHQAVIALTLGLVTIGLLVALIVITLGR